MAADQVEIIVAQIRWLPQHDKLRLLRRMTEILEEQATEPAPPTPPTESKPTYLSLFGSGRGGFATPEEADAFLRQERAEWED